MATRTYPRRVIGQRLTSKGFVEADGGDHTRFDFFLDQKKTQVRTKVSHGKGDVGNPLIGKMARQCRLSVPEFHDLIECRLREEELAARVEVTTAEHRGHWGLGVRLVEAGHPRVKALLKPTD